MSVVLTIIAASSLPLPMPLGLCAKRNGPSRPPASAALRSAVNGSSPLTQLQCPTE